MLNYEGLKSLLGVEPKENAPMVLVYAEEITPRLKYTIKFLLGTALGLRHKFTSNKQDLLSHKGFAINYSKEKIEATLQIEPDGLLNESFINTIEPVFESGAGKGDGLPFDIFSAVFYLISRYEEWQSYIPDNHNRFELQSSSLFKSGLHLEPIIEQWAAELRLELIRTFPDQNFPARAFKVLSTIDVDNLYAYRHKQWWRLLGGSLRDLFKADINGLRERISVVFFGKKDPFDIYEDIAAFCFDEQIPLLFFFLQRTGTEYDRTVEPKSSAFKEVLTTIQNNKAAAGIHPSYDAYVDETLLAHEIQLLQSSSGEPVHFSRQHYLRFNIRYTAKLLMSAGIRADFTMGFSSGPGFRAGTSLPFYFYDFDAEKEQDLLFVPFCVMDGAYTVYNTSSPEKAYGELFELAEKVKKNGGLFISVFHERSFSDHLYKGFGSLYKKLHKALKTT